MTLEASPRTEEPTSATPGIDDLDFDTDEVTDPGPEHARDLACRTAVLLGNAFPESRLAVLSSPELIDVLQELIGEHGFLPEEIKRAIQVGGTPPADDDPVRNLISRCRQLPALVLEAPLPGSALEPHLDERLPDDAWPTDPEPAPDITVTRSRLEQRLQPAASEPSPPPAPPPGFRPATTSREPRHRARRGWRRLLRLSPGRAELAHDALIDVVRRPVAGCRSIVVIALKGGTGKTTTTVMLGHTFATHRDDRVVALDASTDAGTLAYRIAEEPRASVRSLVSEAAGVRRYSDVRLLSGHSASRLDVIASDADPRASRPFVGADYREATRILSRFYNVLLTDCGAGLVHDVMGSTLAGADQLVLVTTPSLDGLRSAGLTLDWLAAHGYDDLLLRGVVVLNDIGRRTGADLDQARDYFRSRCRAVVDIPTDPHLAEGGPTDLQRLDDATRLAYLRLAAVVAEGFDLPTRQGAVR